MSGCTRKQHSRPTNHAATQQMGLSSFHLKHWNRESHGPKQFDRANTLRCLDEAWSGQGEGRVCLREPGFTVFGDFFPPMDELRAVAVVCRAPSGPLVLTCARGLL